MDKKRLERLGEWARDNAVHCILPFWTSDYIVDQKNGGFYGRVTLDMQLDNTEPRSLVLAGRMTYAFSEAYRVFGDALYLQKARYAFEDLVSRFYDTQYGGAFISTTAAGEILADNKPNYCEAFFLMGCAAYYRASGDERGKQLAMETFGLMEKHVRFAPGRYHANMARDWQTAEGMGFGPGKGPAMPEGAVMFPHHLCQAYVQLYKATGSSQVRAALREMVGLVADELYDPQYRNLKTIIGKNGERIGNHQSFGHDCEISYLAITAAKLTGDGALLDKVKAIMADVLENVVEHDFDPYGSLYNGGDLNSDRRDPVHVWWAQAEAVTAMLQGYELTGDEKFLAACERQAAFIEQYFVNREHGDWYSNILVDETGGHIVDGMHGFDKLNGGKCPFHNSQMCFEVMERTERLQKEGAN